MISISNGPNGYEIRISYPSMGGMGVRGFTVLAHDVKEVHEAIDHYFRLVHYRHREGCPLCRLRRKEK